MAELALGPTKAPLRWDAHACLVSTSLLLLSCWGTYADPAFLLRQPRAFLKASSCDFFSFCTLLS